MESVWREKDGTSRQFAVQKEKGEDEVEEIKLYKSSKSFGWMGIWSSKSVSA